MWEVSTHSYWHQNVAGCPLRETGVHPCPLYTCHTGQFLPANLTSERWSKRRGSGAEMKETKRHLRNSAPVLPFSFFFFFWLVCIKQNVMTVRSIYLSPVHSIHFSMLECSSLTRPFPTGSFLNSVKDMSISQF